MSNVQVKDVPADLHAALRAASAKRGKTIRDLILDAVRRDLQRAAFLENLAGRSRTQLSRPVAETLEEVRASRDCAFE